MLYISIDAEKTDKLYTFARTHAMIFCDTKYSVGTNTTYNEMSKIVAKYFAIIINPVDMGRL